MKQIKDLMPLATLEDLREFCLDYARKDKKFNKELTTFLNERFIEDEDSAADFIARLEDAFGEEKNIGDRWHSYYVTNWDEIYNVSTDVFWVQFQHRGRHLCRGARLGTAVRPAYGCQSPFAGHVRQLCPSFEVNPFRRTPDGVCQHAERLCRKEHGCQALQPHT